MTSMGDTLLPGATQPQTLVTPVSARMHQIGAVLGAGRVDPTRELPCHDQIAQILTDANVTFEREHRLAARERIDFMAGSIGIEVKVKGAARTTLRQLERYCAHDAVEGIILLTNKAMSLPKTIKGKPAIVVSIGAAWL